MQLSAHSNCGMQHLWNETEQKCPSITGLPRVTMVQNSTLQPNHRGCRTCTILTALVVYVHRATVQHIIQQCMQRRAQTSPYIGAKAYDNVQTSYANSTGRQLAAHKHSSQSMGPDDHCTQSHCVTQCLK
jgi:hypothetical protein